MTSTLDTLTQAPLSVALKASSAKAHEQAENSSFMDNLLSGRSDRAAFIQLQEQMYFVYEALEAGARALADDPIAGTMFDPALERIPALEADLDQLHGSTSWRETIRPLPATKAYADRINTLVEENDAAGLIAHHYVRYLGDLSGGQAIAVLVRRDYGIEKEALTFFDFSAIGKTKIYKDGYRVRLDALPIDSSDRQRMLAETDIAFECNKQVFEELSR